MCCEKMPKLHKDGGEKTGFRRMKDGCQGCKPREWMTGELGGSIIDGEPLGALCHGDDIDGPAEQKV